MTKYATFFISLIALSTARSISNERRAASTAASTASDITNGVCKPVTLIFARGTTEPGNIGTVVGPPLATAMKNAFGANQVAVQGVDYAADIAGAGTGAISPKDAAGAKDMAMLAAMVMSACPSSKVVLSGYSQGAEQVRGALMNMDAATGGKIAAAVTFGDPLQKDPFSNIDQAKTKVNCAMGDQVCNEMFLISAAHLSYGTNGDVGQSVSFIQMALGAN